MVEGPRLGPILPYPKPPKRAIHATSVDAPFRARENIRNAVTRSRMLPSVRPLARPWTAGLHGSSRSGSRSRWRTRSTVLQPGCPDPVSPTVAPCPPSARPTTTVAFWMRGSDFLADGRERMDERRVDRGNIGAVGRIVAGGEGADAPVVHAGTGSGLGGCVS